jgi:hypothetical protein
LLKPSFEKIAYIIENFDIIDTKTQGSCLFEAITLIMGMDPVFVMKCKNLLITYLNRVNLKLMEQITIIEKLGFRELKWFCP